MNKVLMNSKKNLVSFDTQFIAVSQLPMKENRRNTHFLLNVVFRMIVLGTQNTKVIVI